MRYPNRIIKKAEIDPAVVKVIQQQLNNRNCGPLQVDGIFGTETERAVKLFQTRNIDAAGHALSIDGEVGSITWNALFGTTTPSKVKGSALALKAIEVAHSQIGVQEHPLYSNRGPEVDAYLRSVNLDPTGEHYSWCAAFVYWCFNQASQSLILANPLIQTAGVLDHWNRARCKKIKSIDARNKPNEIAEGSIFIMDHGSGLGHTGIVTEISGGNLTTIEGNTNNNKSRNGYGVFELNSRKVADINKGFLVY